LQDTIDRCLGLVPQYNPFAIAKGGLNLAENVRCPRKDILEDRRGHALYATLANTIAKLMTYSSRVVALHSTTLSYDNGSGTFANYTGTFEAPSGAKMRHLSVNSNLFLTTNAGIKILSGVAGGSARSAGVPRALGTSYTLTGASGFLADASQCAYRIAFQKTDSNNNVITGYPSQRLWVTNSAGGTRNVILTCYLNSELVAGDVMLVYRTDQQAGVSSDISGDDPGLVYSYELAASDITNGYVTFTDSVVDALIGAVIYTGTSQEGIAQANDRPPLAKDIALYKDNFVFFANCSTKQRLNFSLVGTSGLIKQTTGDTTNASDQLINLANTTGISAGMSIQGAGIPAGTTVLSIVGTTVTMSANATATAAGVTVTFGRKITLGGVSYFFGTSQVVSGSGSPMAVVGLTGVAAADIDSTARSLVEVINRYAGNTSVYAYYLSGPEDLPGQIMIEERGIGAAAFTIQAFDSTISPMIFPAPPVSPATTTKSTSSNTNQKNALYFSKEQQPEHVPALNYRLVGPANKEILRIMALRDSLIIIKEEGVYRCTGDSPSNFTVEPLDLTVKCKAASSVALLQNQVLMLSDQGVVSISDTGVSVISQDIEPEILPLLTYSNLSTYTVGVGYESDRTYMLSTVSASSDTAPQQTFIYNFVTKVWTVDTFGITDAIVEESVDKLFIAKASSPKIFRERKDFSGTDYCDPEHAITITGISGNNITFTVSGASPAVGWVIAQDGTELPIGSVSVGASDYTALMDGDVPASWVTGAATLYPSVGARWEYAPWSAGNATGLKQVSCVQFVPDPGDNGSSATEIVGTFRTNFDAETEEVPIEASTYGWGGGPWGEFPWGGGAIGGFPTYVPRNKQICGWMMVGVKHRRAREKLALALVGFTFEPGSDLGSGR